MQRPFTIMAAVAVLFLLSACDRSARLERKAPEEVSAAKRYFDLMRTGHADEVEAQFDSSMKGPQFGSGFEELVATIPAQEPQSIRTVWVDTNCAEGTCNTGVIIEYKYPSERLLLNAAFWKNGDLRSLVGLHIRVIPESMVEANRFTFRKGFPQYAFLALAVLFPVFSIYVLILCIWSKIGAWKWIWVPFIAVGFGRAGMNWTTGHTSFKLLVVQLLSAGVYSEPYGPWTVAVSLPAGAVLFFLWYNWVRHRQDAETGTARGKSSGQQR